MGTVKRDAFVKRRHLIYERVIFVRKLSKNVLTPLPTLNSRITLTYIELVSCYDRN